MLEIQNLSLPLTLPQVSVMYIPLIIQSVFFFFFFWQKLKHNIKHIFTSSTFILILHFLKYLAGKCFDHIQSRHSAKSARTFSLSHIWALHILEFKIYIDSRILENKNCPDNSQQSSIALQHAFLDTSLLTLEAVSLHIRFCRIHLRQIPKHFMFGCKKKNVFRSI